MYQRQHGMLPLAYPPVTYGTIETFGFVLILPLIVQPPSRGAFLKLIVPFFTVTGRSLGPQLPIGDVNVTPEMRPFVAFLAVAVHGRPVRATEVHPRSPVNEPPVTDPTPLASMLPW